MTPMWSVGSQQPGHSQFTGHSQLAGHGSWQSSWNRSSPSPVSFGMGSRPSAGYSGGAIIGARPASAQLWLGANAGVNASPSASATAIPNGVADTLSRRIESFIESVVMRVIERVVNGLLGRAGLGNVEYGPSAGAYPQAAENGVQYPAQYATQYGAQHAAMYPDMSSGVPHFVGAGDSSFVPGTGTFICNGGSMVQNSSPVINQNVVQESSSEEGAGFDLGSVLETAGSWWNGAAGIFGKAKDWLGGVWGRVASWL